MKVKLEVLASASIKRRKPWRKIVWLGKERESLFLLDEKRVSVLYIPSGKTKRNLPKLSGLLAETAFLTPTPGGLYLVGVQSSGEVFVWNKDKDELKTICGLSTLLLGEDITLGGGCAAFASSDCSQLLLVLGNEHVFLWQQDPSGTDAKNNTLLGKWSKVSPPDRVPMPTKSNKETSMHAMFTNTEVCGECCQLSLIFTQRAALTVSTLILRFNQDRLNLPVSPSKGQVGQTVSAEWVCLQYPIKNIHEGCEPIGIQGAYISRYTHDGQVLAVGVNQKAPSQTSVLFISPLTDTVLVSDLRGCGLKEAGLKRGRQYWISDAAWTSDNLFLSVILRNGSAGLLSRLGEPLVVTSHGCSVEMGPSYFLPFTPLISIQPDRKSVSETTDFHPSMNSELDPLHQRFSATTHPTLPILLYSDGYVVIVAQLPSELSPMIFMRDLVLESSSHLRQIAETHQLDLTLANAYNLPSGELESVKTSPRGGKHARPTNKSRTPYSFEDPSVSLNETIDSEVSFALHDDTSGALHNASSGKVIFGEPEVLLMTEGSAMNEANSTMKALHLARLNLFSVWKLAASTSELWSENLDKIVNHTVHNIVKLFSLVLDCPQIKDLLEEATDHFQKVSPINTASLFKVISMYRQLLDLLHFDCQQRHLLASVIQLSHKTLLAILSSVGLRQSDPRLKTLTGCFTLLKFTEKSLQYSYVGLPELLQKKSLMPQLVLGEGSDAVRVGAGQGLHTNIQLAKRLTSTWKVLYKSVMQFLSSKEVTAADCRQGQALQSAIQQSLVELDAEVPQIKIPGHITQGEKLSLDGKHTQALSAWKEQLRNFRREGNVKNAARLFHSLLYTYILRNDLTAAVSFVDNLIIKANPELEAEFDPDVRSHNCDIQPSLMTFVTHTLRSQAFQEPDMVPCIRDRAIRQVVQSMGRFLASYFSNQTVFIFPPHNPFPLPAVHFDSNIVNSRIIPKYHEDLAAVVRHQKLGGVWTVERTLEYLLLSGLVCEAVWFADCMGDWKAAYQLAVAHVLHKRLAPKLYSRPNKPLSLPDWLMPDAIMKRKLERFIKDDLHAMMKEVSTDPTPLTRLTKVLEDVALAGVMGYVELGSWLLESLVTRLQAVVKLMNPLVTKDVYLPAPPSYCPQPSHLPATHQSQEAEEEMKLRLQASTLIQLALSVMNATHLSIPAATWYVQILEQVQKKATQFKANTEGPCLDLPDVLYQYTQQESEFAQLGEESSVRSVQASFRDLCSLAWLLHARDKLSLCLRSREKFLNLGLDVENSEQWLKECFVTLQWAVHIVAFSRFLSDEASIYKVVLSLLLELPSTEDTANILAEHLYDISNLHPEIQERLDRMLTTWQGVILVPEADGRSVGDSLDMDEEGRKSVTFLGASPRGKTLSVYYHKQCMVMDKVIKKKSKVFGSYEEYVFAEDRATTKKKRLNIGSRPFESKRYYMEFLDTFISVSFSKVFDALLEKDRTSSLPFLRSFAKEIVDREMTFFVQRVAGAVHKHQGLSVFSGASQAMSRRESQERVHPTRTQSRDREVPGRTTGRERLAEMESSPQRAKDSRPVGLFRGKSMFERPPERTHATVRRYESEPVLDEMYDLDQFSAAGDGGGSRQNLTNLASRYTQSEESLYRGGAAAAQERSSWSLTVNFGKKYTALQQLLEWLEVWGNKQHSLTLGPSLDILHIAPKMKLHIPAQLIILSLWLLEHKYSQKAEQRTTVRKSSRGRRARRLSRSPNDRNPARSQSSSPLNRSPQRSMTPPKHPDPSQLSQSMKAHVPRRSPQHMASASLHSSPERQEQSFLQKEEVLKQSLQPSTLEEEQIIDAYTQVLDGPEDSSSIGVSSLASDELEGELKDTLNIIRGSGRQDSALNQTIFPKDESPERGPGRMQPKDSSTPIKPTQPQVQNNPSRTMSPPSHVSSQKHSGSNSQPRVASLGQDPPQQAESPQLGQGIAGQLQGIIRSELRMIMEVQHRSVLAMMGALDQLPPTQNPPVPGPVNLPAKAESPQGDLWRPQTKLSSSKAGGSPSRQKERIPSEEEEEMTMRSVLSVQEDTISHSSAKRLGARKRPERREGHVRMALSELQNLQKESLPAYKRSHSSQENLSYQEQIRNRANLIFSGRPPSHMNSEGSDFHLPYLSFPTRHEAPSQQEPQISSMPLLHIQKQMAPQDPFSNLRQIWAQVPAPRTAWEPQPQNYSYNAPPPAPFSMPFQRLPPPPYDQPSLPLLSAPAAEGLAAPSGFPLLRMAPLGSSHGGFDANTEKQRQKERLEETRQKLLKGFHEQILQEKENAERQTLGQQMLKMARPEELRKSMESLQSQKSPRSEKGTPQVKIPDGGQAEERLDSEEQQDIEERTGSLAGSQEVASAAEEVQFSDGYALPRGIFESYLQLGEQLVGPEVNSTNAAFQMKMAQAMQRQVEKRIRPKVDFSTMTQEEVDRAVATDAAMEVVRTAEAATSITKDTGSDPIQEALNEYNRQRHNNVIPPDIFMGLRFQDEGSPASAPSAEPSRGRSYLNVVDIRASAVLRDIPERAEERVDEERADAAIRTSEHTAMQMGALEETLREKLAPRQRAAPVTGGYDSVTVKMFDQLKAGREDALSVAVMPRSSVSEPKSAMIRRLRDMTDQIRAIDEMSQNIERDFKSSHLLLNTIHDVNESMQLERSRSPSPVHSRVKAKGQKLRYSLDEEEEREEREMRRKSPTPRPKTSSRSPRISARSGKSESLRTSYSDGHSLSRSDITDLLGEVLAEEGVDLQSAGFSQEIAEQMEEEAHQQMNKYRDSSPTPRDRLTRLKRAEDRSKERTMEEKEQLKQWMREKFVERQHEYRNKRNNLIEREPKPFKGTTGTPKSNLKGYTEEMSERRKHLASEFMSQRLLEAEHLMGSIIVDKPDIPPDGGVLSQRTQSQSPKRVKSKASTSPERSVAPGVRRSRSPGRHGRTWTQQPTSLSPSARGDRDSALHYSSPPKKGILKTSSTRDQLDMSDLHLGAVLTSVSEGDTTFNSSTDLMNYARKVLEMDHSEGTPAASLEKPWQDEKKPNKYAALAQQRQQPAPQVTAPSAGKGKSLAQMVRLQRPEVTRKWKEFSRPQERGEEDLKSERYPLEEKKSNQMQDPNLQKEKQKVYGSKHIPGSSPRQITVTPRRVKTYSERLQELKENKPKGTFYAPTIRTPMSARTASTGTFRTSGKRSGPRHKPQTYVQQLQNLSSRASTRPKSPTSTFPASKKIPVAGRTFMRSHGPLHKPKTYTDQLKELNPHPQSKKSLKSTVTVHASASRSQTRARPYSDPYADMDYEELASVLSGWDMDEDVRNIIYGGSTAASSVAFMVDDIDMSQSIGESHYRRTVAPSEGQSDYYDVIMQGGGAQRSAESFDFEPMDYRSSVDIREIERIADAEAVSVGSGSVIDWDAVEDLIKDV